jgi:hypothetical protein
LPLGTAGSETMPVTALLLWWAEIVRSSVNMRLRCGSLLCLERKSSFQSSIPCFVPFSADLHLGNNGANSADRKKNVGNVPTSPRRKHGM